MPAIVRAYPFQSFGKINRNRGFARGVQVDHRRFEAKRSEPTGFITRRNRDTAKYRHEADANP